MADDEYSVKQRKNYIFAFKVVLCCTPVMALFFVFGRPDLARTTYLVVGAFAVAIRQKWEFHHRRWFWLIVAGIGLLHLPLFVYMSLPKSWIPAVALIPVALVDYIVVLAAIRSAAKRFEPQIDDD